MRGYEVKNWAESLFDALPRWPWGVYIPSWCKGPCTSSSEPSPQARILHRQGVGNGNCLTLSVPGERRRLVRAQYSPQLPGLYGGRHRRRSSSLAAGWLPDACRRGCVWVWERSRWRRRGARRFAFRSGERARLAQPVRWVSAVTYLAFYRAPCASNA
ncbi:hypothetical protein GY45DRAFT_378964 [Cubamyces sp. BRFM 1775]|nr:hypothetical protein GY45DRAFT_378964 [Cubamyces sp. BRFM 1775]